MTRHIVTDVVKLDTSKRTEMTWNSQPRHFFTWIIPFRFRSADSMGQVNLAAFVLST
jgi:hypothetical protein